MGFVLTFLAKTCLATVSFDRPKCLAILPTPSPLSWSFFMSACSSSETCLKFSFSAILRNYEGSNAKPGAVGQVSVQRKTLESPKS